MPMKNPPHPGRSIYRDCIEPLGMSVEEAAKVLGVGQEELWSLIRGESSITFALAVSLDKLFGGGASTWYELQSQYDKAKDQEGEYRPTEPAISIVHQQTATVPLAHGRVVYTTYDSEVVALDVVPSNNSTLSGDPNYDRVDFRFVGEGPGAVQIQMIYQPGVDTTPRVVADVLFRAYLQWNAEADEYVGHIDRVEWNRETQKLNEGKETMNALYYEIQEVSSVSTLKAENPAEGRLGIYVEALRESEALLQCGTGVVRSLELAVI